MELVQFITYILAFLSLFLYIDLYREKPHKKLFFVPIILYVAHVLVFYTFRILTLHTSLFPNYTEYFSFTYWSAALRLQAELTVFFFAFIVGEYDRKLGCKIKKIYKKIRG